MKKLKIVFICLILSVSTLATTPKTGEDVVSAMFKKYDGKWYKTLTFKQNTITYKPDGTTESAIWYEALSVPGKLRIDFAPMEKGDGMLVADGKLFSFKDGKTPGGRPFVHPLLVLGFDVYGQPVATTVTQLKGMGIDLSLVHEEKWLGRDTYVIGAKQGDLKTPQFWVDKKNLYFVRLIQITGRDKKAVRETQFNKYVRAKGGWVAAEVLFFTDGKKGTAEEYSEIQADMPLNADLWNPEKWMTVDKTYFAKK